MSSRGNRSSFPSVEDLGVDAVNRTELAKMLDVPAMDVSIATCMTPRIAKVRGGAIVFERMTALKDLRSFYRRQYECNRELYHDRHMEMYRDNALKYRARMERVQAMIDELTDGEGG